MRARDRARGQTATGAPPRPGRRRAASTGENTRSVADLPRYIHLAKDLVVMVGGAALGGKVTWVVGGPEVVRRRKEAEARVPGTVDMLLLAQSHRWGCQTYLLRAVPR